MQQLSKYRFIARKAQLPTHEKQKLVVNIGVGATAHRSTRKRPRAPLHALRTLRLQHSSRKPADTMAGASERDVESLGESLIPVVDKLQEILHGVRVRGPPSLLPVLSAHCVQAIPLQRRDSVQAQLPDDCAVELPEVVVVGSQSSGKSSVLESLVWCPPLALPSCDDGTCAACCLSAMKGRAPQRAIWCSGFRSRTSRLSSTIVHMLVSTFPVQVRARRSVAIFCHAAQASAHGARSCCTCAASPSMRQPRSRRNGPSSRHTCPARTSQTLMQCAKRSKARRSACWAVRTKMSPTAQFT